MAPRHHAPAKGGNIKKGICQNHSYLNPDTGETGDCPKCASGEVISVKVQKLSDFRCPVCDGKLTLVKESNTKKIALIAGGGIAAAAIVGGLVFGLGAKNEEAVEVIETDTVAAVVDTVAATPDTVAAIVEEQPAVEQPIEVNQQPARQTSSVLGGAAVIITEGSYKTLRFKRDYDLDLGKSDGSALHIRAGEEINNAHISHGKLRGGNYRSASGEEHALYGLNITL